MELNDYLDAERRRILGAASPERREQMARAEQSRSVYRAWNAVCGGTREGEHVTGLRYLPDTNELLVYLDAPSWTQEMTMLREIIRARMEREGVMLSGFRFKTSREGYPRKSHAPVVRPGINTPAGASPKTPVVGTAPGAHAPAPSLVPLTPEEDAALDAAVAPISDDRLAQALKKAMKASAEWKKTQNPSTGD